MNSKAACREKRGQTAHLQSRRRSLQPMSDIHLSGHAESEQRVPASFKRFSPGISAAVTNCSLVCIPVFSDSDTRRLTAALTTAKICTSGLLFKITNQFREGLHWRFNLSSELVLLPVTTRSYMCNLTLRAPRDQSPKIFATSGMFKTWSYKQNIFTIKNKD